MRRTVEGRVRNRRVLGWAVATPTKRSRSVKFHLMIVGRKEIIHPACNTKVETGVIVADVADDRKCKGCLRVTP